MAKVFRLDRILVDTGIIYAFADVDDKWHQRAVDFISQYDGKLIVPTTVVPEACYLLNKNLGIHAERQFVTALANLELTLEPLIQVDLHRCLEILSDYDDMNIGIVDASLAAIAERLRITKILTTDRRHFSAIRTNSNQPLELLP